MKLQALVSRISAALGGAFSQKNSGTVLVAVLEEFSARGVLVRKKGKGAVELLRFMEVPFEQSIESPKLRLAHLLKQWGALSTKNLLVVSDEFVSTTADLPKPQSTRFGKRKAAEALKAAARFEISPLLDYPANEAMIGVYVPPSPQGEFDAYGLDDSTTIHAMVFALHEKSYQNMEQVCASLKLKLMGMMPEEIFAFGHCAPTQKNMDVNLISVDNERPRIMVNWRAYDAMVALTVNHMPVTFQRHDIDTLESAIENTMTLVDEIVEDYEGTLSRSPMIILGGENAEQQWRSLVRDYAPQADVKRWDVTYDLPDVQAPGVVPARYMTALSAGAQALCKNCCNLLVDNHVPLVPRIVAHPLALPGIILALCLFCLGLEASWLKYQVLQTQDVIATLEEDKKKLDAEVKKGQDAVNAFNGLNKEQREINSQIKLLHSGLLDRQYLLRGFLAGIIDVTPSSIQLHNLQQFSDQVWFLEGVGMRYDVVSKYVVSLKNLPMVRQCRLEKSAQVTGKEGDDIHYSFSLQIRLEEE